MAGTRKATAGPAASGTDTPSADVSAEAVSAESLPWPVLGESLRYTLTEAEAQAILGRRTALARFLRNVDPRTVNMPGVYGGQVVAAVVSQENGEQPWLVLLLPAGDTWFLPDANEGTTEGTWSRLGIEPVPEGAEV
jgi:hypothetical protein